MQRRNLLEVLSKTMNDYTIVFFETKYNIVETIEECISVWGKDHLGCYVRELTKFYEQIIWGPLSHLLVKSKINQKGEYTIVISNKINRKN